MSQMNKKKLKTLTKSEGFKKPQDLLEKAVFDSVVPAICVNDGCDYITTMEPDQKAGYCEMCHTQTVVSCLVLAGII